MTKKQKTLEDYFALSRLNSVMYVIIVLIAFLILYFLVVQFVTYKGLTANKVQVHIVTNDLQTFSDGTHPVLTVSAKTRYDSRITISVQGDVNFSFMNDNYVKEYTRLIVLPTYFVGKDFLLVVVSEDKNGLITLKQMNIRTKMSEEASVEDRNDGVKFGIKKEVEFEIN